MGTKRVVTRLGCILLFLGIGPACEGPTNPSVPPAVTEYRQALSVESLRPWATAAAWYPICDDNEYDPWAGCWCPSGMQFDGMGGCECANGGVEPTCEQEEPPHDDGGDPGDGPPIGGGGDPPQNDSVAVALDCPSSVTIGGQMSCNLTVFPSSSDIQNIEWSFVGFDANSSHSGGESWGGTMAVGGTVRATFTINTMPRAVQADVAVTGRGWSWSSDDWNFSAGAAPDLTASSGSLVFGAAIRLGWACNLPSCTAGFVRPDPAQGETGGYVISEITSGPNEGVFFVSSASFHSNRGSNIRNDIIPGSGVTFTSSDPAQANCSGKNWYNMNQCMGGSPGAIVSAVWAHEGYGYYGHGHQAYYEAAAAQAANDPAAQIDEMYATSFNSLDQAIKAKIQTLQGALAAAGGQEATNNIISPTAWLYSYGTYSFQLATFPSF